MLQIVRPLLLWPGGRPGVSASAVTRICNLGGEALSARRLDVSDVLVACVKPLQAMLDAAVLPPGRPSNRCCSGGLQTNCATLSLLPSPFSSSLLPSLSFLALIAIST